MEPVFRHPQHIAHAGRQYCSSSATPKEAQTEVALPSAEEYVENSSPHAVKGASAVVEAVPMSEAEALQECEDKAVADAESVVLGSDGTDVSTSNSDDGDSAQQLDSTEPVDTEPVSVDADIVESGSSVTTSGVVLARRSERHHRGKTTWKRNFNFPNTLTVFRLLLVPVFLWLVIFYPFAYASWVAVAIFVIAGVTDWFDGYIARSRGLETDFGRIVDPIADKALTLGAFAALSYEEALPWWFTVLIAIREFGITWWRAQLLRKGIVVPANFEGKVKTTLQMLFIFLLLIPWGQFMPDNSLTVLAWIVYGIGGAALAVTLTSGWNYLRDGLRLSRDVSDDQ